jgi:tagatose-6-phosphate ketose/aldose isomerase
MAKLGRSEAELQALGAIWTAREIAQQPAMLRKTHAALVPARTALERFLHPLVHGPGTRVILVGAGTSGFIGECLAPYLATHLATSLGARLGRRVEAIATTDLICAPRLYLERDTPTLLVSFARSGNSPESIAAVDLAEKLVDDIRHLAITCNRDGALACNIDVLANGHVILLPEETHDRSFAMTSSFTCMMYAGLAALCGTDAMAPRLDRIAQAMETVIAEQAGAMRALAGKGHERVVYLGSYVFKGLAREAALKLLELTDGRMIAVHDSPLGFRHGPKTIANERTLVVMFLSNDRYTRRYDLDLLEEIRREGRDVLAICGRHEGLPAGIDRIVVPAMGDAQDIDLLIPFIAAPQIFAFEQAISRGLSPDNPNVSGTVNRVVQGVRIHPLE